MKIKMDLSLMTDEAGNALNEFESKGEDALDDSADLAGLDDGALH